MRRGHIFFFLLLFCNPLLRGNDTLVTLGAGGLVPVKSTAIVMESEDLRISTHKVTIRYVFRNTSDKDIETTIAFPLPQLDGSTVNFSPMHIPREGNLNFVQFSVTANGKPVPTQVEARAFVGTRDVTARLKAVGMPVNVMLGPLKAALQKLPPSTIRQLESEHLIEAEEYVPAGKKESVHDWWATWSMRVQYYWTQRFPANSTVELVQTYRPVVGGSYIVAGYDERRSVQGDCGTDETVKRIRTVKEQSHAAEGDIIFWERRIDYILTTANNWKGPIGKFRLTVTTDSPEDILVTCTSGLQRVSPTRYELVKTNFHPSSELDLLILQARKPAVRGN